MRDEGRHLNVGDERDGGQGVEWEMIGWEFCRRDL